MAGKTITESYFDHIYEMREREQRLRILAIEHLARTLSATAGGKLIATLREVAPTRPLQSNYGGW